MQDSTTTQNTTAGALPDLERAAHGAERWFGEPFLHPGEDAEVALAPGTARRRALDDAIDEIDAGNRTPSPGWKVRYGLMLGLDGMVATAISVQAGATALEGVRVGVYVQTHGSFESEAAPLIESDRLGGVAPTGETNGLSLRRPPK